MNAGLRALLSGLIDYAGLFPPAKLPMDLSVRNYLRYRDEPDAWMLGRFICPAARLHELAAFLDDIPTDRPMVVSALGRGGETAEQFQANLDADLADIAASQAMHDGRVKVDVLETRLPAAPLVDPRSRTTLFASIEQSLRLRQHCVFFEMPLTDLQTLRGVLAEVKGLESPIRAGFKMRMGGLEASAFPTSKQVGEVLACCLREEVPFKATAGLHHPFPRVDPGVKARMHGFINLFAAGMLTGDSGTIQKILEDDNPAHFLFHDLGMSWQALSAPLPMIQDVRQRQMISFGSCSFDEPRDDLRALGWL